ncbi:MAG: glycoside hydrolase family 15 protein, partial [Deltaproteobacteria bacterium]|nr:glycoside hydrolase family 15 protein [Deltaproteobacteria bacterium]
LHRGPEGTLLADPVCDASLWGLFAFGLYSPDDPRLASTMHTLKEKLWVDGAAGGLARYEDDSYHRAVAATPGNPWVICTLWLADYLIQKDGPEEELQQALEVMSLVTRRALPSGVLPEQFHPYTGVPLSVAPLTWSHAAFLTTMHALLRRLAKQNACPVCGAAPLSSLRRDDWIDQLYSSTCSSIHGICKL